ncbi:MAG: AsnC family transcriptional regulator [Candidatus Lokiarchaeota archaeon]|nr:AsnC family transcriptional regulator [Candidatus Lokiarchaeota archaeon]
MSIDEKDRKIIELLREDGRKSYSEISDEITEKELKMTEVTIRRRVRQMIKSGVIKRFTVVIDPLKIGRKIRAFIRVKTVMKEASLIAEQIKDYAEVNEAYFLDGACGLMLKVTVDDLNELRQFLEKKLGNIDGVGEVETCIVLEDIKTPY